MVRISSSAGDTSRGVAAGSGADGFDFFAGASAAGFDFFAVGLFVFAGAAATTPMSPEDGASLLPSACCRFLHAAAGFDFFAVGLCVFAGAGPTTPASPEDGASLLSSLTPDAQHSHSSPNALVLSCSHALMLSF